MKLFNKFMMWYWTRYYLKQLKENPESGEMLAMAQKTGRVRDYWKYIEGRNSQV